MNVSSFHMSLEKILIKILMRLSEYIYNYIRVPMFVDSEDTEH